MKIKDNKIIEMSDKDIKDEIIRLEKSFWVDRLFFTFGFIFLSIGGLDPNILPSQLIYNSSLCIFLIILGLFGIYCGVNKQHILSNTLEIRRINK